MCYGFQLMARGLGGEVAHTGAREYGRTRVNVTAHGTLLADLPAEHTVWMSHGDSVTAAPAGFDVLASTAVTPVAAFEDVDRGLAGVQWHPEVLHTEHGQRVLEHFLLEIAGCRPTWTMLNIIDEQVERIREQVGEGRALCALSGGVDSAVAAAIVRARHRRPAHLRLRRPRDDAARRDRAGPARLRGGLQRPRRGRRRRPVPRRARRACSDPEEKRKIIGREFIRTFEAAEVRVFGDLASGAQATAYLVQGTLYPDVVESGGGAGTSNIKSHHNVGGLPDDLQFELIEPLRTLFKDEVRAVGEQLGLPPTMVWRHPFPGPGLGIRIIGEVTRERLDILRRADADRPRGAHGRPASTATSGSSRWCCSPTSARSASRATAGTYGHPVVLRPVTSEDAMTADWARLPYDVLETISTRITNEVGRSTGSPSTSPVEAARHHRVGVT